jgi:deoxyribodipyrimidine photolyase-related protein
MTKVTIVFPHQLFKLNPAVDIARKVYLVEEYLFFNHYKFHKQKLVLHRASMKSYEAHLLKNKIAVAYIDAADKLSDIRNLIAYFHQQKVMEIHITDVADNWLRKRIHNTCKKYNINCVEYTTPNFINTLGDVKIYFDKKKTYFQTGFYTEQRKKRNILLDASGGPEGGQWTYDADNRVKFPKKEKVPVLNFAKEESYVEEARKYIEKKFPSNYGSVEEFIYPVRTF